MLKENVEMWVIILCICLCPPLLALIIGILGLFVPLGYVCHFFAWFAGLATIMFTLGALQSFDITDGDDWKMLAFSFLIPGGITGLLILLGNWLGEHHLFEAIELLKEIF